MLNLEEWRKGSTELKRFHAGVGDSVRRLMNCERWSQDIVGRNF